MIFVAYRITKPYLHSQLFSTTLIISKKPVNTGKSRDRDTEFTTKLLLLG